MIQGSRRLQPAHGKQSLQNGSLIRERRHRLPDHFYRGEITAAFTLCVLRRHTLFDEPKIVQVFIDMLSATAGTSSCLVPVYCVMPDHMHIMLTGTSEHADLRKTIIAYKQRTGYWLSRNKPNTRWQKDFFDHVIRKESSIATQARYILDNPVRKGLAHSWQEYPFKGAIGCTLDDALSSIR